MTSQILRAIAIHLPQFHPVKENDEWWGKGFTEWTNVTRAKPRFNDHYQPHLPADLGFYDLRLSESRLAQAELAKEYGIDGFCYYHYWFNGKRLLNRPLDEIVESKKPDFPFMICWANENWTRRWDGADKEILIEQKYSDADDKAHIRFLLKHYLSDERYIRVDGKPFLLIYRPLLFPDIRTTLDVWRKEAREYGINDLYIGYMQSFSLRDAPAKLGFDCAVEFHPDFYRLPKPIAPPYKEKIKHKLGIGSSSYYTDKLFDYKAYIDNIIQTETSVQNIYKSITPMWDNSSRRQTQAHIFHNSTPDFYQEWLEHVIRETIKVNNPDNFIFINAWNEWAEGNHLEPCQKWGRAYLEATLKALNKYA